MASNLRRSKRTVSRRISDINRRVLTLQKRPSPKRIATRTITDVNIVPGTVTRDTVAPDVPGNKTTSSPTAPTGANDGDIWYDTDDNNKMYRWNGSSWVSVRDGTIAQAQATADGKNKIYRQTTQPSGGTYVEGDLWFDTDDGNKFYRYTSNAWTPFTLGDAALASISANKITAGTIDASVITVSNINAGNISTGAINASGVEIGNDVGPGTGHNGISLSDANFNNIFLRRESDNVIFFRVNQGGSNSLTFDSSSGVLSLTGTVTASSGTIGGWNLTSTQLEKTVNVGGTNYTVSFSATGGLFQYGTYADQYADAYIYPGSARVSTFEGSTTITGNTITTGDITANNFFGTASSATNATNATNATRLNNGGSLLTWDAANTVYYTNNNYAVGTTSNQSTSTTVDAKGIWQGSNGLLTVTKGGNLETCVVVNNTTTGTTSQNSIIFRRRGTEVGTITVTGSATSFNPSSDYRLKEDIKPVVDSLDVIQQLSPVTFKWKDGSEGGSDVYGLIAHEVQQVLPYVVVGEKDAIQDDGSPKYQQMDYTKLIPLLLAGVQDLTAKVSQLEAEIKSLKNAQ